ncbi:MAG: Phosphoheptose isomerase 1 [Lentisphaerae bacterium ADurb.BinA184]|nr:MAG: Phosphoheptose isomerase 1 [Lentisphaerae bacterium ADurb.BinA184]
MDSPSPIAGYLDRVLDAARRTDAGAFAQLVDWLVEAYTAGRTVFIVGNGGSAANASHLCEDLGKGTLTDFAAQRRLRVISLTDNVPYILAWANDLSFEDVFAQQLRSLAAPGDLLLAISGSGNSPNVLRAVEYARTVGVRTFAATGFDGGRLRGLADGVLHVPVNDMGVAEAVHGIYFHLLVDVLRGRFREVSP